MVIFAYQMDHSHDQEPALPFNNKVEPYNDYDPDDSDHESINIHELQKCMWKDRVLLKKMKDKEEDRTGGLYSAVARHCRDKEQSLRKKMSRAQDGVLRNMLKMMEACPARGFVYDIVPEQGNSISGSSDSLQAWWKDYCIRHR